VTTKDTKNETSRHEPLQGLDPRQTKWLNDRYTLTSISTSRRHKTEGDLHFSGLQINCTKY